MTPTARLIPAGQDAANLAPGDVILLHRPGPIRAIIHAGQWVRPSLRPWAAITHVACVEASDGSLVEAVYPIVRRAHIVEYRPKWYTHVSTGLTIEQQASAVRYLESRVGDQYALLGDVGTALRLWTFDRFPWFETPRSINCSGMAAEMLERGPYDWDGLAAAVCPAELAKEMKV